MAERWGFLFVLWAAVWVWVGMCRCWDENAVDGMRVGMNVGAGNAKAKAEAAMHDAVDETQSWANWADDKFSEGFGHGKDSAREGAQKVLRKAGDAASKATGTIVTSASDTLEHASEKAGNAVNMACGKACDVKNFASEKADQTIRIATYKAGDTKESKGSGAYYDGGSNSAGDVPDAMAGAMENVNDRAANAYDAAKQRTNMALETVADVASDAKDKVADAYDETRQQMNMASNLASKKANDAKEDMAGSIRYGKEKVVNAYDEAEEKIHVGSNIGNEKEKAANAYDKANHQVEDSYSSAMETMAEQARTNYEAAKEKASQAVGDLGAKMRHHKAEL